MLNIVFIVLNYFLYIVYHFNICHCLLHSFPHRQHIMQSVCMIIQVYSLVGSASRFLWAYPAISGSVLQMLIPLLILPIKLNLSLQLFSYRRCDTMRALQLLMSCSARQRQTIRQQINSRCLPRMGPTSRAKPCFLHILVKRLR
jgi:hypothetical protein